LQAELINNRIRCHKDILKMKKKKVSESFEHENKRKMPEWKTRMKTRTSGWETCRTGGTRQEETEEEKLWEDRETNGGSRLLDNPHNGGMF
jgi:hypothetical protein